MTRDPTEPARRAMLRTGQPHRDLRHAEQNAEQRWNTEELARDFVVHNFMAPFVIVTRKSDGVKGVLEFTHSPRWYFNFTAE